MVVLLLLGIVVVVIFAEKANASIGQTGKGFCTTTRARVSCKCWCNPQGPCCCGCGCVGSGKPCCFCLSSGGGTMQGCYTITNDPATWPSGDSIWTFCQAVAFAEGANIAGSVPDRTNNPGDISDGGSQFGATNADGSNVTNFPDKQTGWQWLYNKVQNIAKRQSSVYSPDMTISQIASKWAGNSGAWASNVASKLGVSTDTTLAQVLGLDCSCGGPCSPCTCPGGGPSCTM